MKLQKNDIFAAFKDSRRQLSRFKTGVLSNDSNELVKNKGRSHAYGLASTAGFGSRLTPPRPRVPGHADPDLALDDPTCVIGYKMVLRHKPSKYMVISPYTSRCLRGHCGSASNSMNNSPYSMFGPVRYSYLDATWGNLVQNSRCFIQNIQSNTYSDGIKGGRRLDT